MGCETGGNAVIAFLVFALISSGGLFFFASLRNGGKSEGNMRFMSAGAGAVATFCYFICWTAWLGECNDASGWALAFLNFFIVGLASANEFFVVGQAAG